MATVKKNNRPDLGNFRFRKLLKKYLLTSDSGTWVFLSSLDFKKFVNGEILRGGKQYCSLNDKGFLDVGQKELVHQTARYFDLNSSLSYGPSLFIFVLTLRCNHRCLYCQATPEGPHAKGVDMSEITAKRAVDMIFRSPSPSVVIEFQGGEPVLNWPVLEYIVKYANALNKERGKLLKISLVSNLTAIDKEKIKFLLDNDVSISCSLDGPSKIHDKNRVYIEGGTSHAKVVKQIKTIQTAVTARRSKNADKFIDSLNAILTISKFSLPYYNEIIDEYLGLGFENIFIRPLSPFGLERKTMNIIEYEAEEFINFYYKALDYIIELNLKGKFFIERNAYYILKKIMRGQDPGYYEMRSPCGAGIGQMAVNYDGKIFTCDEGRMAFRMGYENFQLGDVKDNNFNQLIDNNVVKTMCLASCLDNHAGCSDCVYKPFCGICPLANFVEHGTIFPQILNTNHCKINMAMFDYFFQKLGNKRYKAIFEKWLDEKS